MKKQTVYVPVDREPIFMEDWVLLRHGELDRYYTCTLEKQENKYVLSEDEFRQYMGEPLADKGMDSNPIVDICGDTIDLRKVERVGKVGGDILWLRYSIYFTGGSEIEIYQERKYADNRELRQMKREKFIELWRSFNGC